MENAFNTQRRTLIGAVRDIVAGKCSGLQDYAVSIEIAHATGMNISDVERECEKLVADGTLKEGRTLNYKYYRLGDI